MRSCSAKQETLNAITAFNYMQAASNLERIPDQAHWIAQIAKQCKCDLAEDLKEELSRMESLLCSLIETPYTICCRLTPTRPMR